uniref:BTB domain-containing protein n=1 Tax=Gopherus evgoodei TaxID=1825980 RepID=A0A8C4WTJ1_9SAUR
LAVPRSPLPSTQPLVPLLRSQNALCDVTLEADGVRFPAHKIILASLKAISAGGLRNVLNFIYSNKLELSLQNVEETFKAAETLLVREVIKLCFQFLEDGLNHNNCLDTLNIARRLGPEELRQKAMYHVGQHYKQILTDPRCMKELDKETLCEILDKTDMAGCTELELFNAAVSWLLHDSARLKGAADILRRIRFPLIPLRDLQRYVQETPIMRTDSECHRYLQEALIYHSQLYLRFSFKRAAWHANGLPPVHSTAQDGCRVMTGFNHLSLSWRGIRGEVMFEVRPESSPPGCLGQVCSDKVFPSALSSSKIPLGMGLPPHPWGDKLGQSDTLSLFSTFHFRGSHQKPLYASPKTGQPQTPDVVEHQPTSINPHGFDLCCLAQSC